MTHQRFSITFILLFFSTIFFAQITQTVRGTVVDQESQFPLIGVNVVLITDAGVTIGTISNLDGTFRVEKVPLGRQSVTFSYLGYKEVKMDNIVVGSGKEVILTVEMDETVEEIDAVTIIARRNGDVLNEMATISAREFSVEETERYAGSRGDPARMASNFAGVSGADDSRNDIVVRGNSPTGVLWRVEGINIPNPNHFAIPGTGGGPVSILNNKFLKNSDFFTGAFPAEYGNGIAGVFDLRMRNGNNEKHEFSAQIGLLGTELMAEGPISKEKKSSYLATYRFSSLAAFQFLNINLGTTAIPQYQDASFRINFPYKNGANLSVFGIGGTSKIDILFSNRLEDTSGDDLYAATDRDQYFGSRMGVLGISYTRPIDSDTYIKAVVAASHQNIYADHWFLENLRLEGEAFDYDQLTNILDYSFTKNKYSGYLSFNKKLSKKSSLKAGFNLDAFAYDFYDEARPYFTDRSAGTPDSIGEWRVRWDAQGVALLAQPYIQYKYKPSDKMTLVAGLTSMYFSINKNSFSPLEPRLGLSYEMGNSQKINAGLGMHSQIQEPYIYSFRGEFPVGEGIEYNQDLGLTKSAHAIVGYDKIFNNNMRFKAEAYYQYLYEIPVRTVPSSYSLANQGSGFGRFFPDTLTNEGVGRNIGVEFTVEKFFSGGYYFLITGSLFDAKYRGSDDVWRNSSFNGRYAFNGLFAKEFTFKNGNALNIGSKITYAGGKLIGEVDEAASSVILDIVFIDETLNTIRQRDYFRTDMKINYRWNRPKVSHEFAFDLVNIFNTKNILSLSYAATAEDGQDRIREEYQLGFLPVFYYRIDF